MKTLASLIAIVTVTTQSLFSDVDLDIELKFAIGTRIESHDHIVESRKGPPPWAPAHGHSAKGKFHYYPTHQVYRNANTGAWIFYRDGRWQAGVNLPSTIRIGTDSKFVLSRNEFGIALPAPQGNGENLSSVDCSRNREPFRAEIHSPKQGSWEFERESRQGQREEKIGIGNSLP